MRACGTHRRRQKLPQLGLDQTAEFGHLDASLDNLAKDICAAVLAQRNSLSDEVENIASRIPSLEKELEECVSFIVLPLVAVLMFC